MGIASGWADVGGTRNRMRVVTDSRVVGHALPVRALELMICTVRRHFPTEYIGCVQN